MGMLRFDLGKSVNVVERERGTATTVLSLVRLMNCFSDWFFISTGSKIDKQEF